MQVQFRKRKLYPDDLYDDLYEAGLIGEGKVILLAKVQVGEVERRESGSNTWTKRKMPVFDQTEISQVFAPVYDEVSGTILGDWRKGLTSEQVKRINEEAGVPIYSVEKDTPIVVSHNMTLDLSNPIHKAKFDILVHNSGIALSKEAMTEDQEFYMYSPKEERKEKEKLMNIKQYVVGLIDELAQKGKEEILMLLKHEKGLYINPSATAEERLILFKELCWDSPMDVYEVSLYEKKETRIMLHVLIEHAVLVCHNRMGPFYRPSNREGQEYGEMVGENIEEAIKNLQNPTNADLQRTYNSIVTGKYKDENPLSKYIETPFVGIETLLQNVQDRAEYELPEKINLTWISKVGKAGLLAYLNSVADCNVLKGKEWGESITNKELRELAVAAYEETTD